MPFLSGTIGNLTIPHLFLDVRAARTTGTATFERTDTTKTVYVEDGDVIFASSNQQDDRLGECLYRAEIISKAQLDASAEIVDKTGKKLGAVLLELGFINPGDMTWGINLQIWRILQGLFSWRDGNYRLDEGPLQLTDIIPLRVSIDDLILKSLRGLDWKVIRKSLPSLSTVLSTSPDRRTLAQTENLPEDQRAVFSLIDGKRSIEELCALSGAGDYNTLSAVYLFLALKMAEPGNVKSDVQMAAAREAVKNGVVDTPEKQTDPASAEAVATEEMIAAAGEALEGQNYYQMLGVQQDTPVEEIKKAYFRLAKLYHPDRHFDQDRGDLKGMLEMLFARITEAYNTLSDQTRRDEYNLSQVKKAKKLQPEEDKTDRTSTAANQFNKGVKEYKAGNYWGALEAFRWASRLDPGNARFYYYQGLTLLRMPRRSHEAEEVFQKAIELEPSTADYYVDLGTFYLKQGMQLRAQAMFEEAGKWDPDSERLKQAVHAGGGKSEKDGAGLFSKVFGKK